MSSTRRTVFLGLNSWLGSDVPKMEDFNRDNVIIDNAVGIHMNSTEKHITNAEREKWNNVYTVFTYLGNGSANRTVNIDCSFNPTWGIIFAANKVPSVTDFNNTSDYNYFGIVSQRGSMPGIALSGRQLTVSQAVSPIFGSEYKSYNDAGTTYVCIMFA